MGLDQLMLRMEYRSDESMLGRDFYARCLPLSDRLDRAVGYFSSSALAACPCAFHAFFKRGGVLRIVCSPVLNSKDIYAIIRGYQDRPNLLRTSRVDILLEDRRSLMEKTCDLLSWLVAAGRVDLKIAVLSDSKANCLYHEKLGLFRDLQDTTVAFSGSANESLAALEMNFEAVDVFRSWMDNESRRITDKIQHFESLWDDNTDGLSIYTFPRAASLGLLYARRSDSLLSGGPSPPSTILGDARPVGRVGGVGEFIRLPPEIRLRRHQEAAIHAWFNSSGRGILEMATGSGKTITALSIATRLYEFLGGPFLIIVVCPYLHLATQWIDEAEKYGLRPVFCAVGQRLWFERLSTTLFSLRGGTSPLASVVVSNSTFASKPFQALLERVPRNTLVIADEVHNLGAKNLRLQLPSSVKYRLGLSATPKRHYDEAGTTALFAYFGGSVYQYELADALADGVLCSYFYRPILVPLADDEFDDFVTLTRRIGQLMGGSESPEDSPLLQGLLIKRARMLATAKNKIPTLVQILSALTDSSHNLVYCGDGTVELAADATIVRQIDLVVRALGKDLRMNVARYVADTPLPRRSRLRREFTQGILQALVAIRCLDEGVDIPEVRRAFLLASSTNPRQFIQRRGRILRRAPGKDCAEIYDFVVEPPEDVCSCSSELRGITRRLFLRELGRIYEFASLATNGPEALGILLPLRDRLGLLDFKPEVDHGNAQA